MFVIDWQWTECPVTACVQAYPKRKDPYVNVRTNKMCMNIYIYLYFRYLHIRYDIRGSARSTYSLKVSLTILFPASLPSVKMSLRTSWKGRKKSPRRIGPIVWNAGRLSLLPTSFRFHTESQSCTPAANKDGGPRNMMTSRQEHKWANWHALHSIEVEPQQS